MKIARIGLGLSWMLAAGMIAATAAAPAGTKAKDDAPGKIDGLTISRANGTFLGLEIKDNNFVLSFYDEKKKKMEPDVAMATVRWPVKYQPQDERTTLTAGADGTSLTSPRVVRPPHNFKVYLGLFAAGSDSALETYVVDFHE